MDYILLMGSGFLVALALGQLCVARRSDANIVLCSLLFVCFVWLTHGIGFRLGMLDTYPHLNKLHVPFLALTGPLWYIYVRTLLTGNGWTISDRWHLVPALTTVMLSVPFIMQPATFKQAYVEVDVSGFVSLSIYAATRIAELATIIYLAMSIHELRLAKVRNGSTPQARERNAIVLGLTVIAMAAALARLLGSVAGNHMVSVFIPIAVILSAFVGFYCLSHRYPCLMNLGIRAPRARPVTDEGKNRLDSYRERLRENRWHLDPDFKIQQLARRLAVPAHELSELINRESGGNFNHFINALRIETAKELLLDPSDLNMLDIAHASGFNSTSAFYAQFKRFESVPPATYRRRARASTCGTDKQMSPIR